MVDRLVLIGMMGAGKTTVGHKLATHLGWAHFDSDAQVMAATGKSVPELFAEQGEAAFRSEEARVLAVALSGPEPVIVSAAGGVVLAEENRRLMMTAGTVVWLRADPAVLAKRVGAGEGRPLLDDDPGTALFELDRVRRPLYASIADVTVDVDGITADEVVVRILADPALANLAPPGGA
jgi:shikimate kinase